MDANDYTFIESCLDVLLPNVFRDFMGQFPNDTAHQLQNGLDALATNAELFVIYQLGRFNRDDTDYYELQPELRDHRFMDIGGDGCGNFYCMVGNDPVTNELWMWEHDPHNGLTRCEGATLSDYFGPQWQMTTQDDPFATIPADGTIVSRANHPQRSILAPITMQEWQDYIASKPHLELDENHEATNPFTKEAIVSRRWPGRALLTIGESPVHIMYIHGRLMLSPSPSVTRDHKSSLQAIAGDLNATVF